MEKVRVAMIGVGAISGIYLQNITKVFRELDLIGVCDLIPERAEKGVAYVKEQIQAGATVREPKIYKDMYEAFDDPEVEVILNLTRPHEHYEVSKQALLHGKHVEDMETAILTGNTAIMKLYADVTMTQK